MISSTRGAPRIIAIIPARSGSRRIPHKNLVPLYGRPLIAYSCEAAHRAAVCESIVVNTDCPRIAAVAAEHGVSSPVLRPAHLATDDAPTRDANIFILQHLAALGQTFDGVLVLQPTSPLRTADDIREAVALWRRDPSAAVVSVSSVAPSNWCGVCAADGRFEPLASAAPLYRLNGAIYLYPYADYLHTREPRATIAYVMSADRGIDVDTWEDLNYAEYLLRQEAVALAGAVD